MHNELEERRVGKDRRSPFTKTFRDGTERRTMNQDEFLALQQEAGYPFLSVQHAHLFRRAKLIAASVSMMLSPDSEALALDRRSR